MGRIVMSGPQNVSLDGVVQDPDGQEGFGLGGWFAEFGGEDLEEWDQLELDEALARRGAAARPAERRVVRVALAAPRAASWADRLNSMPKYVVSSTLEAPAWNNSTVLEGDVVTRSRS